MRRKLRITEPQYIRIYNWAIEHHPNETCGIILGRPGSPRAEEIHPTRNIHTPPRAHTHYQMDPDEQLAVYQHADRNQLDPIAIWHTHVGWGRSSRPSPADIDAAHNPDILHLILHIGNNGDVKEAQLWRIDRYADHPATPTELEIRWLPNSQLAPSG